MGEAELASGTDVGEYRVEGLLGKGGFGSVYAAVHPLIGKGVAIKVLAHRYSVDPAMLSRFIAEARAVNQIRHHHIIDIFAFGTLPDGRAYYVMELLAGQTLDRYLKERGALPIPEAVSILRPIALALDAAHAAGIAHRDLKPENVFVARDAEGKPFPKLLDFGLVKLLGPDRDVDHKTQSGMAMGTPHFMSPEQCRGKHVDHRTDYYSFGIMTYQLVTGVLPFTGDDQMVIMMMQLSDDPVPPSRHVAGLPAIVDELVLAMMDKDPARRPIGLAATVDRLGGVARPIVTGPPTPRPVPGPVALMPTTIPPSTRALRPRPSAKSRGGSEVAELVGDMHVRLLAGYAPDAVLRAVAIAEIALRRLLGASAAGLALDALAGELDKHGKHELVSDARWLDRRRVVVSRFAGQVREELDDDARRAADIASRFALAAGVITEAELAEHRRAAEWIASAPAASSLLRLDRAVHRKALDDLLGLPRRVLVILVHGEYGQGHDHFGQIVTWRLRSGPKGRWREVVIDWPGPSPSLGTRLAILLERLADTFGVALQPIDVDPASLDGARAWQPVLAPLLAAIDAQRERMLVRHVLRWLNTGAGGDDALVAAYTRLVWTPLAMRRGERVVVGLDLRRVERAGFPLGKLWRTSRAEAAVARAVAARLDGLEMPDDALCTVLPELTSVPAADVAEWLRTEGGRKRDAATSEAAELVSTTRGGRFDLVVERLTALNLDRRK